MSATPVRRDSGESPLEIRFRQELARRMSAHATVKATPTPRGDALTITGVGDRVWRAEPRVDVHGVRPDFVISSSGVPPVAVFVDGQAFHASVHTNRLADDAVKRERLRAQGYRVISLTHEDLVAPAAPAWLHQGLLQVLMQLPAGTPGSGISQPAAQEQADGPLALLEGIMRDPESAPRRSLADALPLLLGAQPGSVPNATIDSGDDLVSVACAHLQGEVAQAAADQALLVYRRPHLVFAARMAGTSTREMALVLDDRPEAVAEPDHAAAWREWLRLSDVLTLPRIEHRITTLMAQATWAVHGVSGAGELPGELPGDWADVDLEYTEPVVAELARLLAAAGVTPAEGGASLDTGSTAELAWVDRKVAVVYADMPPDEIAELRAFGWVVHPASADAAGLATAVQVSLSHATSE